MTTQDAAPLADRRRLLTDRLQDGGTGRLKVAPVSFGQRRLWLVDRLSPGGVDYNVVWPLRLVGDLDTAALHDALAAVVARHEVLRTRFATVDGEPVAIIGPPTRPELPVRDVSGLAEQGRAAELARAISVQTTQPFDLSAGPLVRLNLVRVTETEHVLLFAAHHIVFDGWSSSILLDELSHLYVAGRDGNPDPLPPLPVQYPDYAVWEREWLAGPVLAEQLGFWRDTLAGAPATIELPTDHPVPARRTGRGARHRVEFPAEVADALTTVCQDVGATPFMGLLAAFNLLLSRYTGGTDVVVGTFAAGRAQPELERLIGFFVNTVVLRTDLSGEPTFREVVARSRDTALGAFANQDVPFDRVVEELQPRRQAGSTPYLQAALVMQNTPEEATTVGDLRAESLPADGHTAAFDLSLHLWHNESGGLSGFVEYATDLFTAATITRLAGHFGTLLRQATAAPDHPAARHPMLTAGEHATLCRDEEPADIPDVCLHHLVAAQAARRPDAVAAVCGDRVITYGELDRRANHLAYRLHRVGVRPDTVVGICVERSIDSLVAMLGVLKAGGAYLPLDPDNPPERIFYMLAHSGAGVVVAQPHLISRLPHGLPNLLRLDDWDPPATGFDQPPASPVRQDNLAYVIYTSGSTGRPKGVGVTHRSAISRVHRPAYLDLGDDDVMLHALALSFDVSVLEVFGALTNGSSLAVLAGKALPERVCEFLVERGVTVGWLTAALFHAVIETDERSVSGMRTLIAGGDQLSTSHTERALASLRNGRLVNGYGPTEATVFATTHAMDPAGDGNGTIGRVPIGTAIPDTTVLVLDRNLNPTPVGVAGELYLGGGCLARGYLHRPDLTADRFVPHPRPHATGPGARLYRTGDVVRWRDDGTLVFLGRVDHQVKIRGFRVELGEIEQVLRRHSAVREAIVVARPTGPDGADDSRVLVAYLECHPEHRPGQSEFLAYARQHLPDYMVPALFVTMDALPLNPNGKVDRAALPEPEGLRPDLAAEYVPPRNPIEETLAAIWSQVLDLDRVGVHDNFFDVGGHSLLASRLAARVRKAFGREVPLDRFLASPTIATLAGIVESALRSGSLPARPPITAAPRDGNTAPASFGQRRLWLVDRLAPGGVDYNVVWPLRLVGDLDTAALRGALADVVARHDVLRTRFTTDGSGADGDPIAVIDPPRDPDLPVHDLSGLPAADRAGAVADAVSRQTTEPFDLATGPLLRLRLLRVADAEHVLIVAAHHIVFDGWSASILLRELSALYAARCAGEPSPLPPLPVQYADYAAWERDWLSGPVLAEQLDHWRRTLTGAPDAVELPVDRPRPVRRSGAGARERVEFPAELTTALTALCRTEGATLFMGLLAVFTVLIGRYSRSDDVLVGTFAANRAQPELEELVGFFVNTLVLRTDLSGEPSFREVLARGRGTALAAFAHQDLPFDRIVEELHPRRQAGSVPYVQAALVMQNTPEESTRLGDLAVESLPTDTHTATFDVSLYLWLNASGGLSGYLEYATDLFTRDTVSRIAGHFRTLLQHATAEPDRPVHTLPMLTPHEAHRLAQVNSHPYRREDGRETATRMRVAGGDAGDVRADVTLVAAFERQAARTPDAVAFHRDGQALTYAELDRRATLLARRLRDLGVGTETPIGVYLGRGLDLPVALLGVLKSGGAYLPLDPDNPADRINHMITDSGAEVVITRDRLPGRPPPGLVLQHPDLDGMDDTGGPLGAVTDGENIAAVIYTSGSTGRPKGVALTHRSILNRIGWMWAQCPPGDDEVCCLKTPTGFVDSLWELLGPLLAGVPTVVPASAPRDADALVDELAEHGVTRLLLVPSLLRMLLETAPDLRRRLPRLTLWVSSGEPLLPDLHRRFTELMPGCALHNLYGASEVWDALWPADGGASVLDGHPVPVGGPIDNVSAHLLDRHLNPVPVGVVGELYVGGACLARGYLHRPDLTADRFVPHPGPNPGTSGARLYRTGDLGRWRHDGQVELLGRADDQVKIRGFRVEPGEVETALESLSQVKQAAVRSWPDPGGDASLAAYLVAEDGVSVPALRAALAELLPSHLVPTSYVLMPELPLTATGKVDRRALPEPTPADSGGDDGPDGEPADAMERAVAGAWAEVLHKDRVGVHEDFFDIGGHSLLAPALVARVGELLGMDLPVRTVFEHPTVRAMAVALRPDGSQS